MNVIQELMYESTYGWALGVKLPGVQDRPLLLGTALTSIGWDNQICVYYQGEEGDICEASYNSGWSVSILPIYARASSPLAAVSWDDNGVRRILRNYSCLLTYIRQLFREAFAYIAWTRITCSKSIANIME